MSKKDKLVKALSKKLNPANKSLLKAFNIVEQGNKIVFRMPATFFSLEELWLEIESIAKSEGIEVCRHDLYATVEELDSILTNIDWLWQGFLPKGFMTLIAGEPGIGKSLFALYLAKVIVGGLTFPMSGTKCKKAPVLWIDTEMKQQLLALRSKSMGLDRSQIYIPAIRGNLLAKFDASVKEDVDHIISIIEDKQPALMVVDSLGHSHSRGENRIEEMRPVMDLFTTIARNYRMSVIVVHHLNKGKEGESTEISLTRVRGSTDIVATPVVILALEKGSEENSIKVRQIKNNIGKQQSPMAVHLEYHDDGETIRDLSFKEYIPPASKKTKKEMCADWVYSILQENKKGIALVELVRIGEGLGFTRGNIYSAREVLGERIHFTGTGRESFWHLTNDNDHETIKKITKHMKEKK